MRCPNCGGETKPVTVKSIRLDRCASCKGTWYEKGELRFLKDHERHEDYRWIDFELWRDRERFIAGTQRGRVCPKDGETLQTVHYGDTDILIDICPTCEGLWLDEGEYKQIVAYLEHKVNTESVGDYLHDVREEFVEIFTGPEGPVSEAADFGKVLSLLQLRFVVQHQGLARALRTASRGLPGV